VSAPNGDKTLLDPKKREALRAKGALRTGKTAAKKPKS